MIIDSRSIRLVFYLGSTAYHSCTPRQPIHTRKNTTQSPGSGQLYPISSFLYDAERLDLKENRLQDSANEGEGKKVHWLHVLGTKGDLWDRLRRMGRVTWYG